MFYLYLAQKNINQLLDSKKYALAYTIIEQPLMIRFYESLSNNEYISIANQDLNDTGHLTYKGLWVISNLNKNLAQCLLEIIRNRSNYYQELIFRI